MQNVLWHKCLLTGMSWCKMLFVGMSWCKCPLGACHDANVRLGVCLWCECPLVGMQWCKCPFVGMPWRECPLVGMSWCKCSCRYVMMQTQFIQKFLLFSKRGFLNAQNICKTWFIIPEKSSFFFYLRLPKNWWSLLEISEWGYWLGIRWSGSTDLFS